MASSTNHQEQSTHPTNLQQERQQQELIKLLAQHFHHQFYQLTSKGNQTYNDNDSISNERSEISANRQSSLYQQQGVSSLPIPNDFALLAPTAAGGCLDLNRTMNLASSSSTSTTPTSSGNTQLQLQHHHHQQHLRSQPNTGANLTTSSTISNAPESLVADFANLGQNLYSFNDLNLLSALGMNNLTSNQLVLSLQQQSLLQAAAARQYELSRNFKVEEQFQLQLQQLQQHHHHHHHQQQLQRAVIAAAGRQNSLNRGNTDGTIDHEDDGNSSEARGILKFSINTILGRGSPQSMSTSEVFNPSNSSSNEQTNKLVRLKSLSNLQEDRYQQPIAVDCDPSLESSEDDSCSTTNSSTPQLTQSANDSNSMITINRNSIVTNTTTPTTTTTIPDHHRANQLASTLNSLSSNQQATLRHPTSQHHHHASLPFLPSSTAFPWTVAARGKPRRGMMRRAVFSDSQRVGLEKRFQLQKYISKPDRKKLAEKLGLRDSQVKIWFQNRRMKWRNSKERELLSAGGSREQTLPTRNNPNPDLSDVGETIKRLTTTTSITTTTMSLAK